ncbi:MAG TPA: secretin N-terminal domain-containing protein [bacterium]|nr:secretin N-terminal domain-containing protein [bacterium]
MWHRRSRRFHPSLAASIILALVLLSAAAPTAQAGPIRVTQVTVKEFAGKIVIGITATGRIIHQVTELGPPSPRTAIDLLDAVPDPDLARVFEVGKGNVIRVRIGLLQDNPAVTRIVLDLVRPTPVEIASSGPNVLVVNVPFQAAAAPAAPTPVSTDTTTAVQTAQAPVTPQVRPGIIRLLEFRGVALSDVLSALARLCGWNIITDASVQGNVTIRLVNVTCEEALRFILDANNLGFRRIGNNLIITSAEKLQPPAELPETITYRLAFGDVNAIRAAIAAAVPGIRVAIDPRTNSLLVTGTAAQHDEVRKILASLDIRIQQVMIQVHAIEVNRSKVTDLGLFDSSGGVFGRIILDSAANRIMFTLADATLILFRLQALIDERNGRVLAAPRVATLDGNKATILLGDQFPIVSTTATAAGVTQTVTFVDTGVRLEVTPRLNGNGTMTVLLRPSVSSVVEIITTTQGTRAPRLATRSVDTLLTLQDGQTIVIGGLISQEERRQTLKVPLLGDIPILGELFRFTTTDVRNTELVFLITPTILRD